MGLQAIVFHEKLSETMERFGQDIDHLERQKVLFSTTISMQRALGVLYGDLLEFCVSAALFMKKHFIGKKPSH